RPRPGGGDPGRRNRRAAGAGPCDDGVVGRPQLVATGLARPAPAAAGPRWRAGGSARSWFRGRLNASRLASAFALRKRPGRIAAARAFLCRRPPVPSSAKQNAPAARRCNRGVLLVAE